MKKKIIILLLAIALVVVVVFCCNAAGLNLCQPDKLMSSSVSDYILLFTLFPVALSLLFFNKRTNAYLKKHTVIDAIVGAALILSIWFVCAHFIDWRLSAVIALSLTLIVEK